MSEKNTGQEEINDPRAAADCAPSRTSMEFEDLTLPRDKFSSFRHFFIIHPYYTFFLVLELMTITIGSIWSLLTRSYLVIFLLFLFAFLLTIMFTGMTGQCAHDTRKEVTADTRSSISFLGEVVEFRPGLDENKWDLIAARMNRVFHHNNDNITPYFFYDGADYHENFKSWYVNGSGTANVGIKPIIDKALRVYTDSLEEYWERYRTGIRAISE